MKQEVYTYANLPIPGGGYVTGLLYSEKEKDVLYCRTDIGGVYRFCAQSQQWESLIAHVTMTDLSETFPIAIALDEDRPGSLYIACGVNAPNSGVLAISNDYGQTFRYEKIPVLIHGNLNGRGTADRLAVRGDTIFFASQTEGLWVSRDLGKSWQKITAMPENYLTFAAWVEDMLLVGTAGVTTGTVEAGYPMRGHSLYLSADGGASFEAMEVPENRVVEGCRYNGLAAQRWCRDDKYLYVTFASTGRNSYILDLGYSCDSGDNIDGHIVRYPLNGFAPGRMEDITPGEGMLEYGFSGISASAQVPGMLVASTIVKYDGDSVYLSMDYGRSWREILRDLEVGRMDFRAPYMKPEYNGGENLIHWLSDIKINPFDSRECWFNTGTGLFRCRNLGEEVCRFTDWCDGIEETVHLNVYSMPSGDVQVLDIVGDLGGFAFTELDRPCENSFANEHGDRYITCMNADFSDIRPELVVVTPRGNWKGKTLGGLLLSRDQGRSFTRLEMPFGLSSRLDEALREMERPNVNSGWAAMSPDGQNIVWSVAEGIRLPADKMVVSQDGGKSFRLCRVFDLHGRELSAESVKVFSDRCQPDLFYGFGGHSEFYVSRDGGLTFRQLALPGGFPDIDFGNIDCANKTEVRGEAGKSGVFYLAVGQEGLWKLRYADGSVALQRLTEPGITVYRCGLGLAAPGADYFRDGKAVYFNGIVDGQYGFYRAADDGRSFTRLNTEKQMFGEINSIDGDCRVFGRFYLATGSNGLKVGQPRS